MSEQELEAPKEEKKKGGKLKWIIILVLLLAVLGGGGFFAYTKFMANPEDAGAEETADGSGGKKSEEAEDAGNGELVSLPTFLVNLADPLGRRYLKLSMDVEVRDPDAVETLGNSEPKVRDSLIMLLSSKTFADVSSMENKIFLKKEIVERLNQVLGGPKVARVYFTEMVVQ